MRVNAKACQKAKTPGPRTPVGPKKGVGKFLPKRVRKTGPRKVKNIKKKKRNARAISNHPKLGGFRFQF